MHDISRHDQQTAALDASPSLSRRRLFQRTAAAIIAPSVAAMLSSPPAAYARGINRASWRSARPTTVLVHGAFADAASWTGVISLINQAGYEALAVELPLTSLADDVAVTRAAIASIPGPVVVAGHSYGGAVISSAATGISHVVGLVYAAAYAPEQGETLSEITGRYPTTEGVKHIVPAYRTDFVWIDPLYYPRVFAADIPLMQAQTMAYEQKPIAAAALALRAGPAAWHTIPSWYLVSQNDKTIDPRQEEWYAHRMHAQTRMIASSHASPPSPSRCFAMIRV